MASGFVHLHTHSYFSLLAGLPSPEALAARAAALGQPALALTDTNNMFGAVRFYRACLDAGVQPIFGMQLAVALSPPANGAPSRLILVAENDEGYRNLLRLATAVRTEPPLRDPSATRGPRGSVHGDDGVIDIATFYKHSNGLIVLSGGHEGPLTPLAKAGRLDEARRIAVELMQRLGPQRFFVELQHQSLPGQDETNAALLDLARDVGLPVVATNDVRYVEKEDARAHSALLALGARTTWDDPRRPTLGSAQFHFASEAEMYERFVDMPEALANAAAIAARCRVELELGRLRLPRYGFFGELKASPSDESKTNRSDESNSDPSDAMESDSGRFDKGDGLESEAEILAARAWAGAWRRFGSASGVPSRQDESMESSRDSGLRQGPATESEQSSGSGQGFKTGQGSGTEGPLEPAHDSGSGKNSGFHSRVGQGSGPDLSSGAGQGPDAPPQQVIAQSLPPEVADRLRHELDIICSRGLASYFLIVADIVDEARRRGIRVGPGRGSAASSLVAYCLGITDVDPLRHGLVFERFLNPERLRMPDIDLDVEDTRRDELLAYIRQRFGADQVAQIVTFGTLAARAAVREAARLLNVPKPAADRAAGLIPNEPGVTLDRALGASPELQRLLQSDRAAARTFRLARAIEGVPRHVSVHAAGVVIGDGPLLEDIPLMQTGEGIRITQYAMDDVEALGFLKMDVLGLRTLTVIADAYRWIGQKHRSGASATEAAKAQASRPDVATTRAVDAPSNLAGDAPGTAGANATGAAPAGGGQPRGDGVGSAPPFDLNDPAVYEALRRRGTEGVFQLETRMFQRLVGRLQPERFDDIVALLALGRPGPMQRLDEFVRRRRGQGRPPKVHPALEPILQETYGIILYQEQVMHIAMRVAGYRPAEADLLRRRLTGVGGGGQSLSPAERERFLQGAEAQGLRRTDAEAILAELLQFAGYGFAKSHSVAYGLLTFETAWLRTYYPAQFLAALLTSHMHRPDRVQRYVAVAPKWGVRVIPPDVQRSDVVFSPASVDGRPVVVYGLAAVRHVGHGAAEAVVEARKDGPFRSFDDFLRRLPARFRGGRTVESLVRAGACDGFGMPREEMLAAIGADADAPGGFAVVPGQSSLFKIRQTDVSKEFDTIKEPVSSTDETLGRSAGKPQPISLHVTAKGMPFLKQLHAVLTAHPGNVPVRLTMDAPGRGTVTIAVDRALWVDGGPGLWSDLQRWIDEGKLTPLSSSS